MEAPRARPAGFMDDAGGRQQPPGGAKSVLSSTGASVATPRGLGSTPAPLGAGAAPRPMVAMEAHQSDPGEEKLRLLEAQFYPSNAARDKVLNERRSYPRKVAAKKAATGALVKNADLADSEEPPQVRMPGFGLGAQKLFSSTSIKLPVSAYPLYVEMAGPHNELWHRQFRGTSTVADLKKWIFEKLVLPDFAYELSYAEPGKVTLEDGLRLLTTEEALETRNFVTMRGAANLLHNGTPGVHSIGTVGSTNLYIRVKCMHCGNLLNTLAPSRKFKTLVTCEPVSKELEDSRRMPSSGKIVGSREQQNSTDLPAGVADMVEAVMEHGHGASSLLEGLWVQPDENKHCFYHTKGYELFKAARQISKGGNSEIAKISINNRNYPSRIVLEKPPQGVVGGEQPKAIH